MLGPGRAFRSGRRVVGVFDTDGGKRPPPTRPFLLSAIARPERFEADARSLGPEPVGHARFRDHHAFSAAEVRAVGERARAAGADALLTTAKDAVRLPEAGIDLPVLVLRIAAEIADETRFRARLLAVAGGRQA